MKHSKLIFLLSLFFISCHVSEDVAFRENQDQLAGQWVLVQTSFSTGAELHYNEVKNGGYYQFHPQRRFTSVGLDGCGRGTYQLEDEQLILTYDCDAGETPNPFIYTITFQDDYFILSPFSTICIEGCPSKYKKQPE